MNRIHEDIQKNIVKQYKKRRFLNRINNVNTILLVFSAISLIGFLLLLLNKKYIIGLPQNSNQIIIIISFLYLFFGYFINKRCDEDLKAINPLVDLKYNLLVFINLFSELSNKRSFFSGYLYRFKLKKSLIDIESEFPDIEEYPIISISENLKRSSDILTNFVTRIKELNYFKDTEINIDEFNLLKDILYEVLSSLNRGDMIAFNKCLEEVYHKLSKFHKLDSEFRVFFGKTAQDILNSVKKHVPIIKDIRIPKLIKWIILILSIYVVYLGLHFFNVRVGPEFIWVKPILETSQIVISIIIASFGISKWLKT